MHLTFYWATLRFYCNNFAINTSNAEHSTISAWYISKQEPPLFSVPHIKAKARSKLESWAYEITPADSYHRLTHSDNFYLQRFFPSLKNARSMPQTLIKDSSEHLEEVVGIMRKYVIRFNPWTLDIKYAFYNLFLTGTYWASPYTLSSQRPHLTWQFSIMDEPLVRFSQIKLHIT